MIKGLTDQQIIDQLEALKAMTVRTGIIHEAQTVQLQIWPLVAFPFALSSVAEINPETHTITFKILTSLDKEPSGKSNEKAKQYIIKWVRNILWDDTYVIFRFENHGTKHRASRSSGRRQKNS